MSETENGDLAYSTSGSDCLDFFVRITRSAPIDDIINSFQKAWIDDKEIALKILMNMRDIRKGKGEKLIPCIIVVYLSYFIDHNTYKLLLEKIINYGYWKDILQIIELKRKLNNNDLDIEITLFSDQLKKDINILDTSSTEKKNCH